MPASTLDTPLTVVVAHGFPAVRVSPGVFLAVALGEDGQSLSREPETTVDLLR